mgnify:CR=1 FL=1
MTISIAGAGVAGLCCALELAKAGFAVEVFEQGDSLDANGCSRFAGGMLAPWCETESAEPEVLELGRLAVDWWDGVTDVTRAGTLVVAPRRDASELTRFANRTTAHRDADIDALEPALSGRFSRGLFYDQEAHLDPRQALRDLAAACQEQGVAIHFGTPAPDPVDVDGGGVAAMDVLTDLRPVRGEMVILKSRDVTLTRTVRLLHPRFPVYVVPRGDGVFMVGATMIESANWGPVPLRSMMELLGAAYALHPGFAEAEIIETGVGLRPAYPDNLPRLTQVGGTFYVNGLYRHGYLRAPAMAAQLAERLLQENRFDNHRERHRA